MTSNHVIITSGDIAEATGEKLHLDYRLWPMFMFHVHEIIGRFLPKNDEIENFLTDLASAR